jgi:coenzyme F420-0:L-glutamate ligase/coenzyme F420-1:gamma-L-glutamate ligase
MSGDRIEVRAPDGIGEITADTDLVGILVETFPDLQDGDVVVVTSKVVSKAEGRTATGTREDLLPGETVRVVARRGPTTIVENHLGLVMAAAGIDSSNVAAGRLVLLPRDPDASARALRKGLLASTGCNVAVVVTDTAGRAWREGQTDIAIGAAGVRVLDDHTGRVDPYGNTLQVTSPAVADELAGAAELVAGKLARRPFVVVRGRPDLVLEPGDDGPGAVGLLRPEGADLFGWGSREAVLAALRRRPGDLPTFGSPVEAASLCDLLRGLLGETAHSEVTQEHGDVAVVTGEPQARWVAEVAAYAHGWEVADDLDTPEPSRVRLRPGTP